MEPIIIRLLMRSAWANKPLSVLTTADVVAYRDERLREVKASSLHRQFCIIKHAAEIAEEEWGWDACSHIFNAIKIKRTPSSGVRRLSKADTQSLIHAAGSCRNRIMQPLIILALETGIRRGGVVVFGVGWRRLQAPSNKPPENQVWLPKADTNDTHV